MIPHLLETSIHLGMKGYGVDIACSAVRFIHFHRMLVKTLLTACSLGVLAVHQAAAELRSADYL